MILICGSIPKIIDRYFYRKRLRRQQNRIDLGSLFFLTPKMDSFYEYGFN
jgi:hypothetical protein